MTHTFILNSTCTTNFTSFFKGPPFGQITFTALSMYSMNIQVEKSKDVGPYKFFTVRKDNWIYVCDIAIYGHLDDCTDIYARHGRTLYRIGAKYDTGSYVASFFYVNTLDQNRAYFFKQSVLLYQSKHNLMKKTFIATQDLYPETSTETSITVGYIPEAGVNGSQMVVRNAKLGRFFGVCDTAAGSCTTYGLTAGFVYDVWVRTCEGSNPRMCIVMATPAQISTFPKGRHCQIVFTTFIMKSRFGLNDVSI